MYQRFLWNAARNALAANDISIYERAFNLAKENLNGEQSVRNLQLPTPKMLARKLRNPLAFTFNMQQLCIGLWLAEWAFEHKDQLASITWDYFPALSRTIAQEIILEG